MLSKKFWKSIKKDGFLITHLRGHRASRHAHSIAGVHDLVKRVGQDEFGNNYYEEFNTSSID